MSNVSGIIKSIQDIMRKDVGVDGDAQRISQLVWMFFLKIFDDREEELELLEDEYVSPLPEELRWRSWATDREGMTGDGLFDFVNQQLFPTLKELGIGSMGSTGAQDNQRASVVRNVFADAYNYMKSGTLMRQVINKICEINFNSQADRHTFGAIYEQILKDLQSAGNAGEFYTPRAVTEFIVNRVDPRLAETVLDPACGTGGFLASAIEHKREQYVRTALDEEVVQQTIHGVEKKSLPHMLCVTNMILHSIDTPVNIRHDNTLTRPLRDYREKDRVQIIITNPPFGGVEEDGIENNFPTDLRTRETADLFMTLIIHLLKKKGRAAVVLPDGFFFGEGMKTRLKEKLLSECNLHTIVRLPNGVFNPYTGIKTNLLFFTKGQPTEAVWYYEHPYPEGVKNYNKTKPMQFAEFAPEIAWWGSEEDGFAARKETEQAWKVGIEEIKARNYNLDIKNPHVGEQVVHDPEKLLADYARQQEEISDLRAQLKGILSKALTNTTISVDHAKCAAPWQRVVEHFDILFTTEQSIDQLKQTILQLAVMGKLVPQNPDDEPASVLLEKIAAEKARMIKDGKIKRQKKLPEITAEEKPFALPDGWEWTRLGLAGLCHTGKTPSTRNHKYYQGDTPFLGPGQISTEGNIGKSEKSLTLEGCSYSVMAEPGDIVMVCIGGSIGKNAIAQSIFAFNQQINSIHPLFIDSKYLSVTLNTIHFQSSILERASGTATPIINRSKWETLPFPLSPLAEQHRIVTKVNELLTLCDTLKTRLQQARTTQVQLADALVAQAVA